MAAEQRNEWPTASTVRFAMRDPDWAQVDGSVRRAVFDALDAAADEADLRTRIASARNRDDVLRQIWRRATDSAMPTRGVGMDGDPMSPVGLYYICPHHDEDAILLAVPVQTPRCPAHDVPMQLVRV